MWKSRVPNFDHLNQIDFQAETFNINARKYDLINKFLGSKHDFSNTQEESNAEHRSEKVPVIIKTMEEVSKVYSLNY